MKNQLVEERIDLSLTEFVNRLVSYKPHGNVSFACWRNPLDTTTYLLIHHSNGYQLDNLHLEELNPGFIIKPYRPDTTAIYLPSDILIKSENNRLEIVSCSDPSLLKSIVEHEAEQFGKGSVNVKVKEPDEDYLNLVKESIRAIKNNDFEKVVPSRAREFQTGAIDIGRTFSKLCKTYQNAFVTLTYTNSTGLWVGASPELLIGTEGPIFKTVALAGTQQFNTNVPLSDVAWTQKEIEEQAFVSRYIINCFKKIRLRDFSEHGPKTIKAGNLIHLKTDFEVDMQSTNFLELGSTMLKLLHPTSAVCGMPLETAHEFLSTHENYNRELYSGYLGPVNINGKTAMYVNLRCMKVLDSSVKLFAGAGVTEDSIPEKELAETNYKMATLLSVLES